MKYVLLGLALSILFFAFHFSDSPVPPAPSILTNAATHQPTNPPNILLFLADDWSYPHAGVYG